MASKPAAKGKKSRTARAYEFRPTWAPVRFLVETFGNRHALLRLGIAVAAILILTVVVEGWRTPFTYRLGQIHPDGVTARVDFEVVDDFATNQARNERRNEVPFVFTHDPRPIENLEPRLRNALKDVADAESLEDVPVETRAAFGLTSASVTGDMDRMATGFGSLKQFVAGMNGENELQILAILAEFKEFLQPVRQTGIVEQKTLDFYEIRPTQTLAVLTEGGSREIVTPSQVLLREMIKDTGSLGKYWDSSKKLAEIRPQLERWLLNQVPVTLTPDAEATARARDEAVASVPNVTNPFQRGTVLVEPGVPVDDEDLTRLRAEYAQMRSESEYGYGFARTLVVAVLVTVLVGLNGYYLCRNEPRIVKNVGQLLGYTFTVVVAITLGRLLSFDPWRAEVIPLIAAVMVLAIAYNQVLAAMTAFSIVLVVSVSTVVDFGQFIVLMAVCTSAVIGLGTVSSRSTIIKVGFATAVVHLVVAAGTNLLQSSLTWDAHLGLLLEGLRGAGWCILAGYLVAGSLPFIESTFGVVTDISLLEMSDVSHPLLQELVQRAPGTYNHSMTVATIGEAAADRIGANGLLVRVGAYFHDVGKMLKPEYFIENQTAEQANRHDQLAPAMSTLIIIGHVKDGAELARQHNLPQRLIDFVEQHHGTTLVEYFYREAEKRAKETDHEHDCEEASFRYPGPKPQTREAAVMMMADCVESASRTLDEPTPKRIGDLVERLVMKRLLDGQFEECPITLDEVHAVRESLVKSLIAIYHGRIKYPEQRTA